MTTRREAWYTALKDHTPQSSMPNVWLIRVSITKRSLWSSVYRRVDKLADDNIHYQLFKLGKDLHCGLFKLGKDRTAVVLVPLVQASSCRAVDRGNTSVQSWEACRQIITFVQRENVRRGDRPKRRIRSSQWVQSILCSPWISWGICGRELSNNILKAQ